MLPPSFVFLIPPDDEHRRMFFATLRDALLALLIFVVITVMAASCEGVRRSVRPTSLIPPFEPVSRDIGVPILLSAQRRGGP
ncbi:MAG: hypothetical protein U0165_14010 [Polyangiaceae bacterium]